jgi:hypothetical protein
MTAALDSQFYYQLALDRPLDFALLAQRRLPMALANAGLVVLIYFYARSLFGRGVALISALLSGLDPFYLSDARTMRGDSLMAGLMTLSVLGLLLAERRQSWRQLLFSGVMAGLSLLTKMSALPIFLFGGVALVGLGLIKTRSAGSPMRLRTVWQKGLWPALVWLAVAGLTCFLLWPALWVAPHQVWQKMVEFAANSADGRPTYFMGQHTETELLPFFYPVTFFFRATPLTLIGLGLLLAALIEFIWRWKQRGIPFFTPRAVEFSLIALYSLIYTTAMTAGLLKRSWYILPVFPLAMIAAAYGWVWLAGQIRGRWTITARPPVWPVVSLAAITGILVVQILQATPAHPYYYAYWNPLAIGKFAPVQLEMLSWGLDTSLAAQWLNAQPQPEKLKVAIRPSLRELRPLFKGVIIPYASEELWAQADYIVLRQRHLQLVEEHEPYQLTYLQRLTPVQTLSLNGVTFGWIYPGPAAQVALNSELTGKATLLGYTLPDQPLRVGQPAPLKLYWRHEGLLPEEHLFARLVDNDGFVWEDAPVISEPGFEAVAQTAGEVVHSQADLSPTVGVPPGQYFLKIGIEHSQSGQHIGEFVLSDESDDVTVTQTVTDLALPPLKHSQPHAFGPDLLLLGYNSPDHLSSAEKVDLYWQAQRDIDVDYVLALRLRDRLGQEVWYQLARPARGIYPTPDWEAGEIVHDPWTAPPAEVVPTGPATLELEVYDASINQSVGKITLDRF